VSSRGTAAVLVSGVAAQLSIATVGAMPWFVLPLSVLGYVAGGLAADRAEGSTAEGLRWAGTALALLAVIALGPGVVQNGDRVEIKGDLGLMLVAAQVGQAMSWRALRDVRSGLVASFGLLVLAASYAPDVLIGAPLLVGWVAVLLGLTRLGGVGRLDAVRATSVAVALGLAAYLLIPVEPTDGALARLGQQAGPQAPTRLPTDAFRTDTLDLRTRGALSTAGLLRVPRDSPPLWRAISFDQYDGTSWRRDATSRQLRFARPPYQVSVADGPVRTDEAERLVSAGRSDGSVWSPGRIVTVDADGAAAVVVDAEGDVRLASGGRRYTVTSLRPLTDAESLRSTSGTDLLEPRWRSLPVGLPSRVFALAKQITASSTSRYESAELIADYLRTHATYRLDSPVPLPGEDAVDRFLFVDRTGFCEQFASAQVVMLRALGIPARLVTGLGYGVRDGDKRLFRVSDLHAWTELWVQGQGWVPSDPTAGVPLADANAGQTVRQRVANALTSLLRRINAVPGGKPAVAAALVLLAVLASRGLSRRSRRTAARRQALPAGPALQAFLRLDERLGDRRRRQAESLRELAARLDPGLAGALNVVERECYSPTGPDAGEVRAAVAVLDRASAPAPEERRARPARPAGRGRTARRG
jgi:transglutaminase-like putative cysteine protease